MDHPLLLDENAALRRRVVQHLRSGYTARRAGNIIFVCGGNESSHMRMKFRDYCASNHADLDIFLPEFAMTNYFSYDDAFQFDIADFEEIVASLSHAIVVFPEAAGSYAETGYFSANQSLAEKTILAMNAIYQGKDSFLSMGPARKIGKLSRFSDSIYIEYSNPVFDSVVDRIRRYPLSKNKKHLSLGAFKDLSNYELFCLIHKIVDLLVAATIDDILFIMNAIFSAHISKNRVTQVSSILVGSKYLCKISEYGHYNARSSEDGLLSPRYGQLGEENAIRLEIGAICAMHTEFVSLIEGLSHAPA